MSVMIKKSLTPRCMFLICRPFSCTQALETKLWRMTRGLNVYKNTEAILRDTPDYSYLDGRPTPLLVKQKKRFLQQQEYASKIVQLSWELDFAKQRHKDMERAKEEERQTIINNRLKPKGDAMNKRRK